LVSCAGRSASRMNATSYRRPGFPRTRCRSSPRPMSSRRCPLVLIVDDCECVRVVLKVVMREVAGIRSVGAATSEEALKLTRRRRFDAVISDIGRPGMDGLEFLKTFKQLRPTVPVIIASGVLDDATARRAKWLRAFDCLPKPFAFRELIAAVRAAIASRKVCRTVLLSSRSRNARFRSW
jgi:DNA-binding NarL/FixJ family response regulator